MSEASTSCICGYQPSSGMDDLWIFSATAPSNRWFSRRISESSTVSVRSTPHPVTVTTRIITFLVGNPYKPSFATVTGWGVDPKYQPQQTSTGCWVFPTALSCTKLGMLWIITSCIFEDFWHFWTLRSFLCLHSFPVATRSNRCSKRAQVSSGTL